MNVNDRVIIVKGCAARGIHKHAVAIVKSITPLGADYGHSVRVVLTFATPPSPMGRTSLFAGRSVSFYARHINRLSDALVNLNDGNPLHKITVRVKE